MSEGDDADIAGRAKDEELCARIRLLLEQHPTDSNVPLWRAVLAKGRWGIAEWREAVRIAMRKKGEKR